VEWAEWMSILPGTTSPGVKMTRGSVIKVLVSQAMTLETAACLTDVQINKWVREVPGFGPGAAALLRQYRDSSVFNR
jgi:hypothetical protein